VFLCRMEAGRSAGSKMGLCLADDVELDESCSEEDSDVVYSSSDVLSSSFCVLNFPPCMGGRKFVHRPSIRPI
jgi:hypothetical protein